MHDSFNDFELAWSLIRREGKPPICSADYNWDEIVELLQDHGILGYISSKPSNCIEKLPKSVKNRLEKAHNEQKQRNFLLKLELDAIAKALAMQNQEATVVKGLTLLEDLYDDYGARNIADIDLLVDAECFADIAEILIRDGYSVVKSNRWGRNDYKMDLSKERDGTEVVVELHSRLFYNEYEIEWAKTTCNTRGLVQLNPSDALVHLLGHLGYQHTFIKLSWLVDIDLFIRKYGESLDWTRICELSERLKITNSIKAGLWAARQHLHSPVPTTWLNLNNSFTLQKHLTSEFFWYPRRHMRKYLTVKHLVKDSFIDSIAYNFSWVKNRVVSSISR